jgi:Fe-S cluster biogenesis protein NfuA
MSEKKDVKARIQLIEGLVEEIEKMPDPAARSVCQQLVESVMDLHGSGFERMLDIVYRSGGGGQEIIDEMGRDELVRSLLLLYGLHPLDLRTRVLEAVEKSRPLVGSHGAKVEIIDISDSGRVTLRVEKGAHSCHSTTATLRSTLEQAIYEAAPEVTSVTVEGGAQEQSPSEGFVSIASLQASAR